jgi:hypothetical protein
MNTGINKGGANMDWSVIINGQHHDSSEFGKAQSYSDMMEWIAEIVMNTADDPSKAKIEGAMLDGKPEGNITLSVLAVVREWEASYSE